jgi:hypothetical protein
MYICMYVYMHMLSYSIYARTWGFRGWGIMYIHILCMHIHVYYISVYVQLYIYIQHIHIQGWIVYLYTYIYTHNCVMLSGLFLIGFAFWEFRVCFLKACVRVFVYMCVGLWSECVCLCSYMGLCCYIRVYVQLYIYIQHIHIQGWHVYLYTCIYIHNCVMPIGLFLESMCARVCVHMWGCEVSVCVCVHTWVCAALYVANVWEYMYTSWYHGFFCFPLFNSAVAEFRVCVLSSCGGMCACKCMYWSTHTHIQARIHVYACMYVRPAHRGMTRPWPLLCGREGPRPSTFPRRTGTKTRCLRCCRRARLSTPKTRYGATYSLNVCVYVLGLGFRLGCACACACACVSV